MPQNFLYSEKFDFKSFYEKPTSVICLLFVPRSGSTLLACLMQQTMALGFPLEYFDVVNINILARRLPGFSLSNLDPLIRVRTSPNGIFSFKLSNRLVDKDKADLLDRLNAQHFLVIDRRDQEAQVRSLAMAIQTKQWVRLRGEKEIDIPRLTETNLLKAKSILYNDRESIRQFISQRKISALHVSYEELISRPKFIISQICKSLAIQICKEVDINKVPIRRQS